MKLLAIAFASGAISAFAFAPVGWWPLMPLAIAALCELVGRAGSLRQALLTGWLMQSAWPPWFSSLTLMFQKEVAERIDVGRIDLARHVRAGGVGSEGRGVAGATGNAIRCLD